LEIYVEKLTKKNSTTKTVAGNYAKMLDKIGKSDRAAAVRNEYGL